jgi:hypothetical protein
VPKPGSRKYEVGIRTAAVLLAGRVAAVSAPRDVTCRTPDVALIADLSPKDRASLKKLLGL